MWEWESLRTAAVEVGCPDLIVSAQQLEEALLRQEKLKIVVTGIRGSGKTTLINRMVGVDVWPAGNMDDQEQPLRVAFEPMAEEEGYNCLMAVNREWNGRDAVLYELREEDILDNGQMTARMEDKDMVLFLVSALAPFSRTESDLLKALAPLHRQVVLTNLPMVREGEREKVREYAVKINDSLGLPPLVVLEEQDIGREIRGLLPGLEELTVLRKAHVELLRQHTVKQLAKRVESAIRENQEQMKAQADQREEDLRLKRQAQSNWRTLKDDLQNRALKAKQEVLSDTVLEARHMSASIIGRGQAAGFDAAWEKQLGHEFQMELNRVLENEARSLVQQALQAIRKTAENAAFLRLSNFREDDFRELEQETAAPLADLKKNADYVWPEAANSSKPKGSEGLLLGTAVALGGISIAPIPRPLRAVGGLSVLGVAGVCWNTQSKKRKEDFSQLIQKGSREALVYAKSELQQVAEEIYRPAITYLEKKCAVDIPSPADTAPFQEREQTLRGLLATCQGLISE